MSKWIITKGPSISDYRDENHVPNKDRVSYSKSAGKEYNDAIELLEDMLKMDELKTAYRLRMYLDRASNDFKYWRVTFCFDCLNENGRKSNSTTNRIYTATFELNAEPAQKALDGYEGVELDLIDEELQDATSAVGLDYQWMNYDVKPEDLFESRRPRGRILKEMKSVGETVEEYTVKVSFIDLVVFDVKTDEIVYDSSDIHAKDDTVFGFADDVRDEMLHKTFSSYDELGAYTIEKLFGLDLNDDKKYLWNDQGDFAEFVAWTDEDCSKSLPSTDPKVKYCWQLTVGYDTQFKESRRPIRLGRMLKKSADR